MRYYAVHTFSDDLSAEAWLATERRLIELDTWTPPAVRAAREVVAGLTVREYAAQWMEHRDLAPKTRSLYTALLDSRILPPLGDSIVKAVTPADIRAWWVGLGKDTPTRNIHSYQLLKSIFNTAIADQMITVNPCQIASAGKPPKPRDVKPLTPAELVKVAEEVPANYRVAVPVAAWCGLRFGELIELRRKDVHDDGELMTLKIRRAATRVDNTLVVGKTKTDAGLRDVTVPPHVASQLRDHMKVLTKPGADAFVFTTTRGQRLSTTAFTKQLKKGFAVVGKPDMRIHDLRHVGATFAAQAGATTKELMSRLGHATPGMAMRYQIAAQERDVKIAEAMSALAKVSHMWH
ncbi:site-specific integrase [Mycobacterium sp. MS1601]|uniref:site-specific integrase n=1 Tax=Mycobacterium sp. MS1601 TaxID=1936029 RepID=UPI001F25EB78|nr:site-specific integrase [Mycobacterium sp. MS1601]